MDRSNADLFQWLPEEMVVRILAYAPTSAASTVALSAACSMFRRIIASDDIWKPLARSKFSLVAEQARLGKAPARSFRDVYRDNLNVPSYPVIKGVDFDAGFTHGSLQLKDYVFQNQAQA